MSETRHYRVIKRKYWKATTEGESPDRLSINSAWVLCGSVGPGPAHKFPKKKAENIRKEYFQNLTKMS